MVTSKDTPVPGSLINVPAINKIPPEVLTEIFRTACFPSNILNSLPSEPVIITLSAICSVWRQLIWGTPSLWAALEVDFRISGPSMVGRIRTFLNRSGTAPLRMRIMFGRPSQASEEALGLLISSSERWTTLDLCTTHRLPSTFGPSIRGRLDALEKLKLSYIVFNSAQLKSSKLNFRSLFAGMFSVAPSLRSLEIEQQTGGPCDCTLSCASLPWENLDALILRQIRVEEDLLALSMCPNADQVEVDCSRRRPSISASPTLAIVETDATRFSANTATAEDVVELFSRCRFPMLLHLDLATRTKTDPSNDSLWDIATSVKDLLARSSCALTSLRLWHLPVSDSDVISLLDLTPTLEVLRISESVPMRRERRYTSEDKDFEINNIVSPAFLRRLTVSRGEDNEQTADVPVSAHSGTFLPHLKDILLEVYLVGLDQKALRDTIASRTCLRTVTIRLRMRENPPNLNSARLLEEELRSLAGSRPGITVGGTDSKTYAIESVLLRDSREAFEA